MTRRPAKPVPSLMPKAAQVWPNGSAIELESRDVHIRVNGLLAAFFRRRFRYESVLYPRFKAVKKEQLEKDQEKAKENGEEGEQGFRLDVMVAASGFSRRDQNQLEQVSNVR